MKLSPRDVRDETVAVNIHLAREAWNLQAYYTAVVPPSVFFSTPLYFRNRGMLRPKRVSFYESLV